MLKKLLVILTVAVLAVMSLPVTAAGASKVAPSTMPRNGELRRPVSQDQPMWIVHIDTWNYADPAKIIELIPEDILPYVVFNISMSINYDHDTKTWGIVNDGYELAKSWLRTCAEKNVWAMIKPASGGQCHFPDYPYDSLDGTLFEEFFRDYPNFLGFNYCEQFWGFDQVDFPVSAVTRYKHFANLLELTNAYGGYLVVSWCGNQWSPNINPLAMLKRVSSFEEACRKYTENFILCEKYTQQSYIQDMESLCLGAYLSGYSGQYGIRYDSTGWSNADLEEGEDYTMVTGLSTHLEKLMQAGLTVIDGPELIWNDDFYETWGGKKTSDGYTSREWKMYDQFQNVMIDLFRKIIDGTIRIPSREEVINNTKICIIQDINVGSNDAKYSTPENLFMGLYTMPGDGALRNNRTFFKSTGRYPSIPVVYGLADSLARSFEIKVNASQLSQRWQTQQAKVNEFNGLFPKEYAGNVYARRNENSWTVYNPFKTDKAATGRLYFKYNTCDYLELSLSQYGAGVINEYPDSLSIYLNNYDNKLVSSSTLKKDIIKIYGASSTPVVTWKDRGVNQARSSVKYIEREDAYSIVIWHNGPIELNISCSGDAADRLTEWTESGITAPESPMLYAGDRQYEAEHFEYKNIKEIVKNGCNTGIDNFSGQGYLSLGTSGSAAVKDEISVLCKGSYSFELRYSLASGSSAEVDLYINGKKSGSLTLSKTGSTSKWAVKTATVDLKSGSNTFELKVKKASSGMVYIDSVVISAD